MLKVSEIFYSIQGEGSYSGLPCTFIRLSGCNLNCSWCDTDHTTSSLPMSIANILAEIEKYPKGIIQVTGGEPLIQPETLTLLNELKQIYKYVLLETNGEVSIANIPPSIHISMDIKPPSSGHQARIFIHNLQYLKPTDDIKIVIADEQDFEWAQKTETDLRRNGYNSPVILQPAYDILAPETLATWIGHNNNLFRLGIQLHKIIFKQKELIHDY